MRRDGFAQQLVYAGEQVGLRLVSGQLGRGRVP
jgi:hypothetical protein